MWRRSKCLRRALWNVRSTSMSICMYPMTVRTRTARYERDRIVASGFRASALLVAALSAAACASSGAMQAPQPGFTFEQDQSPTTRSALQSILLSRKSSTHVDSPSEVDRVLAFYVSRNFQPAWTGDAHNEEMAEDVRVALSRAHEQGLRDEDYALSQDDSRRAPGE